MSLGPNAVAISTDSKIVTYGCPEPSCHRYVDYLVQGPSASLPPQCVGTERRLHQMAPMQQLASHSYYKLPPTVECQ